MRLDPDALIRDFVALATRRGLALAMGDLTHERQLAPIRPMRCPGGGAWFTCSPCLPRTARCARPVAPRYHSADTHESARRPGIASEKDHPRPPTDPYSPWLPGRPGHGSLVTTPDSRYVVYPMTAGGSASVQSARSSRTLSSARTAEVAGSKIKVKRCFAPQ